MLVMLWISAAAAAARRGHRPKPTQRDLYVVAFFACISLLSLAVLPVAILIGR